MELERSIAVDGVRLAVREWPGGRGGALLLHGLASTSHIWDLVAPRLARELRVVAYDQRGHGRSAKPSAGYGFERMTADALAVMRALRLARPVVVGHSWGANVALELAVRHPRAVAGAILLDGGFLNLHDRMDWPTARNVLAPPDLAGIPVQEFLRKLRFRLGDVLEITPEIEAVFLSLVRVDRRGRIRPRLSGANHLRILHALWAQDALGLLGRVRVPVLVLGVRSPSPSPDSPAFQQEKIRAASLVRRINAVVRFEWIEGIHDIPLQRPAAVAARVLRFARRASRIG